MFDRLANLDRRWTFLLMGLAVALPILFGARFPEEPSPMVRDVFAAIDELPDGSRILMAFDYDPASQGELHPMAAAFTRHAALKHHKLYYLTLWPPGNTTCSGPYPAMEQTVPVDAEGRATSPPYTFYADGLWRWTATSSRSRTAAAVQNRIFRSIPSERRLT